MADFTADRGLATFPVFKPQGDGALGCAYGTYNITANPTPTDVGTMCRVPSGATVVMGWVYGDDLDTGVETLDFDVGWNVTSAEAADPDGFGNFGVVTGDAVTGIKPEVSIWMPLGGVLRTAGPKTFSAETEISVTFNAAAAAGGTGFLTVVVLYLVP